MRKIKDNMVFFIITCIIAMLPTIVGLIFWNKLPGEMVVRYAFDGTPDGTGSKAFTVFFLGLFDLAVHLFCSIITAMDKKDGTDGISSKLYRILLCLCPAISVLVTVIIFFPVLGFSVDIMFWEQIFIGVIYLVLGNYMPKAKPNHVFGTRIKTTFESKKNWHYTHRFTGWCLCVLGLIFIISAVTGFMNILGEIMSLVFYSSTIMLFVLLSVGYSYFYKIKHEKDADYYDK